MHREIAAQSPRPAGAVRNLLCSASGRAKSFAHIHAGGRPMGAEARTIDLSSPTLELDETPREPRFLYADSEPFPHDFDFIGVLTGFVELSAAVLTGAREA